MALADHALAGNGEFTVKTRLGKTLAPDFLGDALRAGELEFSGFEFAVAEPFALQVLRCQQFATGVFEGVAESSEIRFVQRQSGGSGVAVARAPAAMRRGGGQ